MGAMKKLFPLLLILLFFPQSVSAHRGGQDANGGHYNRATGEYHCHRAGCVVPGGSSHNGQPSNIRFNRKNWKHWTDTDHDCQNTRNEILIRDSIEPVRFNTERKCKVASGVWVGPYTGAQTRSPRSVDIDHIIPLGHAFEVGGNLWSREQKEAFANDFENLLATSSTANRSKGKRAPHQWMPPDSRYHCEYIRRWVGIKQKYGLSYMDGETEHIKAIKESCQ